MTPKSRQGAGNVMKVIELGLEQDVYNAMKLPGFSAEGLARTLTERGTNITAQSVRKFIKKTKKAQQELISQDLAVSNQVKELTINYSRALKDILSEVEEVKNMAKTDKDMATYNQLVGRLYQGIELIAKLTGDIKPKGSVDINIIYNEINANVDKDRREFRNAIFTDNVIDVEYEIKNEEDKLKEELNK